VDRQIVFPGSIPLDTDILSLQRNIMVALGYLAQATLGSTPLADGLACSPTAPASLTVTVGPGSIAVPTVIDANAFGSLPADTTDPLIKMGVNTTPTSFTLTAPATSGQSINYLIQANLLENDASPVVLPYYNAANPAQPFSGPNNDGVAQNTQRLQRVQLQLKPGAPANAGSQVTPPIDSGWVGLYAVTVNFGQTQITSSSIAVLPSAPFVQFKLGRLTPGFSRITTFTTSGTFVVPNGVTLVKVRMCGGGGGAGASNQGGGGGGAGGYAENIFPVTPGQPIAVTIGAGGNGGVAGGAVPGNGGTTSFGTFMSATGGNGGVNATSFASGGSPGSGNGGSLVLTGGYGSDGNAGTVTFAGNGGASAFGGGGRAASAGGFVQQNGPAPGSGGGACYLVAENGGIGAPGIVIVEY
jgi:hypothetical protein